MAVSTHPLLGVVVLVVATTTAGCSSQHEAYTVGVTYCTSPQDDTAEDVQEVEYRQGDEVVASTSLPVGTLFRAEVPADGYTEIYADGRLMGSSGDPDPDPGVTTTDGYTALLGEGCPEVMEP